MERRQMETTAVPWAGGAYSMAIRVGNFVFTAGMSPHDAETGQLVGTTVEEQTAQVMRNLRALLGELGVGLEAVVKTTVHLADMAHDFRGFDQTYREFMSPPYPVRTTVGSRTKGDIRVEIDMVAVIRDSEGMIENPSEAPGPVYLVRERPASIPRPPS